MLQITWLYYLQNSVSRIQHHSITKISNNLISFDEKQTNSRAIMVLETHRWPGISKTNCPLSENTDVTSERKLPHYLIYAKGGLGQNEELAVSCNYRLPVASYHTLL